MFGHQSLQSKMSRTPLLLLLAIIASNQQVKAGFCRDVTLDVCEYGDNGPFETSKGLDEALCQQFCSDVYPGKCTFFIYDRQQKVCELFDSPQSDYQDSCQKISGPKTPDVIEDCPNDPDPCLVSIK